jgi:hypothetical protein
MGGGERRKCKCCRKLIRPDPRNQHHQHYCFAPAKAAAFAVFPVDATKRPFFIQDDIIVLPSPLGALVSFMLASTGC